MTRREQAERAKRIRDLADSGLTVAQIQARFGLKQSTVQSIVGPRCDFRHEVYGRCLLRRGHSVGHRY